MKEDPQIFTAMLNSIKLHLLVDMQSEYPSRHSHNRRLQEKLKKGCYIRTTFQL